MLEKIVKIISEYQGIPECEITLESHLVSDLGLNSFDLVALITQFEDLMEIEIPDRKIRELQRIKDIVNYFENETL